MAEPSPEKKHLLGGVKLGHEASIGINAWYYPRGNELADQPAAEDPVYGLHFEKGWHGGVQPIGYAAVATAGLKRSGELDRDDIARVTGDYLAMLCGEARTAGLPPDKVYTHQGGTYAPWEKTLPWWPAFNADATPGWSFYFTDPAAAAGLGDTLDSRGSGSWAAVEWWWQGNDEAELARSLRANPGLSQLSVPGHLQLELRTPLLSTPGRHTCAARRHSGMERVIGNSQQLHTACPQLARRWHDCLTAGPTGRALHPPAGSWRASGIDSSCAPYGRGSHAVGMTV